MPPKRLLATLAAVMLVVSGMGGIASAGTTSAGTGPADAAAQSDDGFDEDDLDTHEQQLEDAGSFNATITSTTRTNGSYADTTTTSTTVYSIDLDDDREYKKTTTNSTFSDYTTEAYTFNDTTYEKTTYGTGEPTYSTTEEDGGFYSYDVVNATQAKGGSYIPADADYESAGTTTVDGVSVTKYVASGEDVAESDTWRSYSTYSNGTSTLYVDDDGLVRKHELSLTQESSYSDSTTTINRTYEVTEVGGVSVDEPGWLDEAREAEEEEESYFEEDCGTPTLDGTFTYEENPDGTYDVTFNATTTENVSSVDVYVEGKQFEKSDYIYTSEYYDSETTAQLNDVEPESTVKAVAQNDCGDQTELTDTTPEGEVVDLTDQGPITSDTLDTHESELETAGSFNSTFVINQTSEGSEYGYDFSYNYTQRYAIDLDDEVEYMKSTSSYYGSDSVSEAYTENGTTYQKSQYGSGEPYYSVTEEDEGYYSYDVVNATRAMGLSRVSADAGYEETGTTTLDGETVTKYTASGERLVEADAFDTGWTEYANGTSTLYVDDDGLIQKHDLTLVRESSYSNATTTTEMTFTLDQVGGVSVNEPDWTDEAEDAQDDQNYYDEDDGKPTLDGEFTTEQNDDGTYDVTFDPSTMENVSYVEVYVEDDESTYEYIWSEDDDAELLSVDPGSTVVAETFNDDGDSTELTTSLPEGTVEEDTGPINESTFDTHESELEAAGSFNSTVTRTYTSNGSSFESSTTSTSMYSIDLDNDREYMKSIWSSAYTNSTSESYTLDGTSYTKSTYSGENYYYVNNESDDYYSYDTINASDAMGNRYFAPGADYEEAGTTTIDGETVTKYVASGEDLTDSDTMQERLYSGEYESATSTLYIDDDGIVRKHNLTYTTVTDRTDTESTTTIVFELGKVGGVSVDEPSWLDEAKNSQNSDY